MQRHAHHEDADALDHEIFHDHMTMHLDGSSLFNAQSISVPSTVFSFEVMPRLDKKSGEAK